jgi:hypothetical protein
MPHDRIPDMLGRVLSGKASAALASLKKFTQPLLERSREVLSRPSFPIPKYLAEALCQRV